jgi:hypothetical protein
MTLPHRSLELDRYIYLHTISLLENIDPAAFERALVDAIMPHTHVSRRTIRRLSLEHRLLKGIHDQGGEQYIWQVRASNLEMVEEEPAPDYEWLKGQIEEDVRIALAAWAKVDSAVAFQEVGSVKTTLKE